MNGNGSEQDLRMEEKLVFMWGYLPGALPQRAPILSPTVVPPPQGEGLWKDVCGGGCGFAVALSDSGKLITWGSADDLGQSYVASGKHGEMPEPFPLPSGVVIVNADAGWAHCVASTVGGDVYTWGWNECIPSGKVLEDSSVSTTDKEEERLDKQGSMSNEQVSVSSHAQGRSTGGSVSASDSKGSDEVSKRRRLLNAKQAAETAFSGDDTLSAVPCLVALNPSVRILSVAAGGRHTLVLSDVGQVWGWGHGGEGQLGMGSRVRMVTSPHPIPCIDSSFNSGNNLSEGQASRVPGSYVKAIACGGRHSAVITDAGALLTFGWGLYGQCGQGSTDDELSPICVSSLLGIRIDGLAAGLWHTVSISADGDVYAFGGNQFGQLGTGGDLAETLPRLLEAPSLENTVAKAVSCGARHSAVVTDDGQLVCWGWNKYGQLGLGDVIDRNTPCHVPLEGCVAKKVACGWWHTLLLAEPRP